MTTASRTATRPRWAPALLAAVLAVAAGLLGAGPASGLTASAAQNAVGASTSAATVVVGPSAGITAGQRLGNDHPQPGIVVATGVAAETLPALEQGAARVPSAWGEGLANTKGAGTRWFDPAAPKANGARIDEGLPGSSWPSQQVDHVVVRSEGRILGPDGKPIVGSLKDNPQAHIPLSDWLNWTSWNAP